MIHRKRNRRHRAKPRHALSIESASPHDALLWEVRRWALALSDAIELGLVHLVAGREERLRVARERLAEAKRERP